ncbi:MAG: exo-alpha-sialidase [Ignavibacteria bacterium]|nr:exo-alpha-sialidase [Ignavibacteria bacterium]
MKILLLITVAVFICIPYDALAQRAETFLLPKATTSRQFPKIRKNVNGTLVLTYVQSMGSTAMAYVIVSKDSGMTWSHPQSPGSVPYASIGLQRQPYAIADNQGILHCIWENNKSGEPLRINYSRSTNDGATWSVPVPIDPTSKSAQDFSSIAADNFGNIYVTCLNGDLSLPDGYQHVFLIRSTDRGLTWEPRRRVDQFIAGGGCECCQQNVAVSPNGEVAVVFRSNIGNQRDIFLSRSADQGVSFDVPVLIQSEKWMINACPATGPNLTYDKSGDLHIAWRDSRNSVGKDVAYYAQVPMGSRVTPKNIDLNTGFSESAEYPVPTVLKENPQDVLVVFESSRGVAYSYSKDAGKTFTTQLLDESIVRSSSVCAVFISPGVPFVVWQTQRDGLFDIARAQPTVFVTAVEEQEFEKLFFASASNHLVRITSSGQLISSVTIHNLKGHLINTTSEVSSSIEIPVTSAGVVLVTVTTLEGNSYRKVLLVE